MLCRKGNMCLILQQNVVLLSRSVKWGYIWPCSLRREDIIKIISLFSALGSMQMPRECNLLLNLKSKLVQCWLLEQSLLTEYHRLAETWPNQVQGRLWQSYSLVGLQSRYAFITLSTLVVLLIRWSRNYSLMLPYNALLQSRLCCRKSLVHWARSERCEPNAPPVFSNHRRRCLEKPSITTRKGFE